MPGWKLVWMGHGGEEEIVAKWCYKSRWMKTARFMFVNSGATGEFGDRWTLMAVTTFLRIL
jgi:hypothetical protein